MKKLRKIYLDTSVISYLDQQDAPERMAETHVFWERIKAGDFDVVLSDVTVAEIMKCETSKSDTLFNYLGQIKYTAVEAESNDKVNEIASQFVNLGILRQKSFDDCRHIAAAITSGCDAIVSWNFKHIVNHKTIMGVKAVTALEECDDLLIYTPSSLIGGDEDDS
jgi:predicted nucleic acid-binding protein